MESLVDILVTLASSSNQTLCRMEAAENFSRRMCSTCATCCCSLWPFDLYHRSLAARPRTTASGRKHALALPVQLARQRALGRSGLFAPALKPDLMDRHYHNVTYRWRSSPQAPVRLNLFVTQAVLLYYHLPIPARWTRQVRRAVL